MCQEFFCFREDLSRQNGGGRGKRSDREPAVDLYNLSGDVPGGIGKQKSHDLADFFRRAEPAQRNRSQHFLAVFCPQPCGHVRVDQP